MKKFCALLISVIMAAAVMTSCGDADSSSKKDSSKAAADTTVTTAAPDEENKETETEKAEESKPEETKATEDVAPEESKPEEESSAPDENKGKVGPLAKAYSDKIANGVFSVKMKVTSSLTGSVDAELKANKGDTYTHANIGGLETEIYKVGGKTVTVFPGLNAYKEGDAGEELNVSVYQLDEAAVFVGSGEEDGLKYESYKLDETGTSDFDTKYYFDADGNVKKIVTDTGIAGEITVEFDEISFDNVEIKLPDTSGMLSYEELAQDPAVALKATLQMFGITEDMVKKSGYTYEQLLKVDEGNLMSVIKKIADDNGVKSELLDMYTKLGA